MDLKIEYRQSGCIGEVDRYRKELGGRIVWVDEQEHVYFIAPNGGVLNTEDRGFFSCRNYTQEELLALVGLGQAQFLGEGG